MSDNERKAFLEGELARLRSETKQLEDVRFREAAIANEIASIEENLRSRRAPRSLPMLEDVRIASPCSANWDEMLGNDRVRFCLACEKNVFNLSAMTREEGERLLADQSGETCVRLYQRADGTVLTSDCPVGVKKKRRKKLALAVVAAGAATLAGVQAFARQEEAECTARAPTHYDPQGNPNPIAYPPTTKPFVDVKPATPDQPPIRVLMGARVPNRKGL